MQCETCTREQSITLSSGQQCCSYCRKHLVECEARYLLNLPLPKRREQLDARSKTRGTAAVEQLKKVMEEIFHARKNVPTVQQRLQPGANMSRKAKG